jgi:hypothetical protein
MIAKGMSKNFAHPKTLPEIFEDLEFKRPFKKPQVVEDFGHSLQIVGRGSTIEAIVSGGGQDGHTLR